MMRVLLFIFLAFFSAVLIAQENSNSNKATFVDVNYFRGNIALHNNSILHLITGHPEGIILSWNRKTFGEQAWQQRYKYPDYGISFSYQDLKNEDLGNNYGLYGHFNFYFFKRNFILRIGQGIAFNTNPYDKFTNFKNIAFGSQFMSSTYVMLNYKKERIFDRIGFQAGFSLLHYSNANVKAPNTSINSITLNLGLTYNLNDAEQEYIDDLTEEKFKQPIKYNFVLRGGMNASDIVGSGQFPFYVLSAYADKRLNHKSAIQFGADMYFSKFLKELILYNSVAFPAMDIDPDTDYKRLGIFVGHELFVNRISIVTQLGYYIYYPFDFEGRTYQRIGLKYYVGNKWFGALTLKSHAAKAEAVELGIGIRL